MANIYLGNSKIGGTKVKGSAESTYREGNVNITPENLGITVVNNTADNDKSVKYAVSALLDSSGNTIVDTYATKDTTDGILERLDNIATSIKFNDVIANNWIADSTYSDFGYRCDISCEGVLSTDYAEVVFAIEQAISGEYAPVCETKAGIVSIWSSTNVQITIPTIVITR